MENQKEFEKELKTYSLDDLKLIYETQKDLYTEEEMELIKKRIDFLENPPRKKKRTSICPKCDGPNPYTNDVCDFCGAVLDKNSDFDSDSINEEEDDDSSSGNWMRYLISFLFPFIGIIMGVVLLCKNDSEENGVGLGCILCVVLSSIICSFIYFGFLV